MAHDDGDSIVSRVLITGCPRSGTKYIARLLTDLGCEVGHETMGPAGISSWCMAVRAPYAPWGPAHDGQQSFDVVLHQVRNPTLVIPSLSTLNGRSWEFIYRHVPCTPSEPLLLRCARLWYHWNLHAEAIAKWRYRLEALAHVFDGFCDRTGARRDPTVFRRIGPNVNSRAFRGISAVCRSLCDKARIDPILLRRLGVNRAAYRTACPFSWSTLRSLDRDLAERVQHMAIVYGYTADDLRSDVVR